MNIDKIIDDFNENELPNKFAKYFEEEHKKMNKEELMGVIRGIKIQVEVLEEIINYKDKEIERLNNIINELEKEISNHIALCTDITLNDILDKLQELKGSDKE